MRIERSTLTITGISEVTVGLPEYTKAVSPEEAAIVINTLALRHDEHAYLIGRHLEDQKITLGYGRYGEWLRGNVKRFSDGTARTYRRYSRECLFAGRLLPFTPVVESDVDVDDPAESDELTTKETPNFEFHTPPRFIEAARRVMGGIDLDPASCDEANDRDGVRIPTIFTLETDRENPTLERPWCRLDGRPSKTWHNPPYGKGLPGQFCNKLMAEHALGRVEQAIVLLSNMMIAQGWFQRFAAGASICLLAGQITDWSGADAQKSAGPWGNVIIAIGVDHDRFAREFSEFGLVGIMGRASALVVEEEEVAA